MQGLYAGGGGSQKYALLSLPNVNGHTVQKVLSQDNAGHMKLRKDKLLLSPL